MVGVLPTEFNRNKGNRIRTSGVRRAGNTFPAGQVSGDTFFHTTSGRLFIRAGTYWKMINTETYSAVLSNFIGSAVDSPMTVGTLTIPDPGVPVRVTSRCTGSTSMGPVDNVQFLETSLDDGDSFTAAPGNTGAGGSWAVQQFITGTPTGDIQVRLQVQQNGGSVGMKQWLDPYLIVELTGA